MAAGALYGVFIGSLIAVLTTVFPAPAVWFVFWAALALQLTIGARIVWKRTSLPMMTTGFLTGAAESVGFAIAAAYGIVPQEIVLRYPWVMAALLVLNPTLLFSEAWFHRERWRLLKSRAATSTFIDMLAFRHIPDLRDLADQRDA